MGGAGRGEVVVFRRLSVPSTFGTRPSGGEDFRFRSPFSRSFRRSSASNVEGGFRDSPSLAWGLSGKGGASLGVSVGVSMGRFGAVTGDGGGGAEAENFLVRL